MPRPIIEENEFSLNIITPEVGEIDYPDTVDDTFQKLANRTLWLKNNIDDINSEITNFLTETEITTLIEAASGVATLSTDVFADLTVGGIDAGDTVPAGTTLQGFAEKLLSATFNPTFTAPTLSLSTGLASQYEIGHQVTVSLNANFNRGSINGDLVSSIWNPSVSQGFRAGPANEFTINSVSTGLVNTLSILNYTIVASNSWSASVDHDAGPQPLDSKGNPYLTPLAAGTLTATSPTTFGRRRYFWGTETNTIIPTTSAEIRNLSQSALNASNGTSFTINIPIGAEMVLFAYPDILQEVSNVNHVESGNFNVKGTFEKILINVEGANGHAPILYKVYYFIPVEPFPLPATYVVII